MRQNPLNFPLPPHTRYDPLNFLLECPICAEPFRDQRDLVKCHFCNQTWCISCDNSLTECPYCREFILGREQQSNQAAQQRRLSWSNFIIGDMVDDDYSPHPIFQIPPFIPFPISNEESDYSFNNDDQYSFNGEPMNIPSIWRPIVYPPPNSPYEEEEKY